jgi:hypothetical protein
MSSLMDFLNAGRAAKTDSATIRSGQNMGTLSREGILASHSLPNRIISTNSSKPDNLSRSRTQKESYHTSSAAWNIPSRECWQGLGEGWFQTNRDGGSIMRTGLHSIVESSYHNILSCMYVPRSQPALQKINGSNPEFDLELSVKFLSSQNGGSSTSQAATNLGIPYILVSFKSSADFFALKCDYPNKMWWFVHVKNSEERVVSNAFDESVRPNTFYTILIQIRGGGLSVDVNGIPLFTSIRCPEGREFQGLVGLAVDVRKFIWQSCTINSDLYSFH